jgi:hypothetical protein
MKKKILLSLVACFIAAGSFIHFNLAQYNNNSDISLADISVMAQADGESGSQHGLCVWEYSIAEGTDIWFIECPYCDHYWRETDDIVERVPCQVWL